MDQLINTYLTGTVEVGERNIKLYSAARRANDIAMPKADAYKVLGAKADFDGLTDREISDAIESAYRAAPAPVAQTTRDEVLAWDSVINMFSLSDEDIPDETAIPDPRHNWETVDLPEYLSVVFQPDEFVPYTVTATASTDGKAKPATKGQYATKSKELIRRCCNSTASEAVNLRTTEFGAWIRINPFDGTGVSDSNVTDYRHCLVESDTLSLERQLAVIRGSRIPCAAIVHSGKKSIHAIVRVDAGKDAKLYRKRVDNLYKFLEKHGFKIDRQNKNVGRLSRLPGVWRGDSKQYLIDINCGEESWEAWEQWVTDRFDGLPPIESMKSLAESPPPLDPVQIEGILRCGHKMIFGGPSKAGKSFALIWLGLSLANGREWFGHRCGRAKTLYLNFEIARPSAVARFMEVATHYEMNFDNMYIWNLRGTIERLEILVPKLVKRISEEDFECIIIDPIYKLISGDENSNYEMSVFCGWLDRIASECGVSVIFAAHFSKGQQGAKKPVDRIAGAGVLGRDPDAIIVMSELEKGKVGNDDAYRLDYVLREFPTPGPSVWRWQYPVFIEAPQYSSANVDGDIFGVDSVINQKVQDAIDSFGAKKPTVFELMEKSGLERKPVLGALKMLGYHQFYGKVVKTRGKSTEGQGDEGGA